MQWKWNHEFIISMSVYPGIPRLYTSSAVWFEPKTAQVLCDSFVKCSTGSPTKTPRTFIVKYDTQRCIYVWLYIYTYSVQISYSVITSSFKSKKNIRKLVHFGFWAAEVQRVANQIVAQFAWFHHGWVGFFQGNTWKNDWKSWEFGKILYALATESMAIVPKHG